MLLEWMCERVFVMATMVEAWDAKCHSFALTHSVPLVILRTTLSLYGNQQNEIQNERHYIVIMLSPLVWDEMPR